MTHESYNDYDGVICHLGDRWRVIECRDGIQWILQTRHGKQWDGRSYCQTRQVLLRCIRERIGECDTAAVQALPDWIGGSGARRRRPERQVTRDSNPEPIAA